MKQTPAQSLIKRTEPVTFFVDGQPVQGRSGDCIAIALLEHGITRLGTNAVSGSPRGMFCCMGICQECVVLVNAVRVEACRFRVEPNLQVTLI